MNNHSKELAALTYSALKTFRNCRRMYDLRYNRHLVPIDDTVDALALGTIFHGCMERWYGRDLEMAREQTIGGICDYIDGACPNRVRDERQKRTWNLARAMFTGYLKRYPSENFDVFAVEKEFECPIINPETDCASRSFIMRGKVDGIIVKEGRYFLLEHKTASQIDGGYIDRLPMDFQIILYAHYIELFLHIPISGILYNVVGKTKIIQLKGETEAEFEVRRADLIAKSKTGKSTAKRKLPESDDEFQLRLAEKYSSDEMFHRELLIISRDQFRVMNAEVWELSQQLLLALRTGFWYMNTDFCFNYHRPCAYFPICRSGENPNVIENFYRVAAPHSELSGDTSADEEPTEFIF